MFLPLSLEDPSARHKYNPLHVNWIQITYDARIHILGSSPLHVNSSLLSQQSDEKKSIQSISFPEENIAFEKVIHLTLAQWRLG